MSWEQGGRDGFSRAYLHHLDRCGEMLGPMLATVHNLHYYLNLMQEVRDALDFRGNLPLCERGSVPTVPVVYRRNRRNSIRPNGTGRGYHALANTVKTPVPGAVQMLMGCAPAAKNPH